MTFTFAYRCARCARLWSRVIFVQRRKFTTSNHHNFTYHKITPDRHGRLQRQSPTRRTENQNLRVCAHIRPSELQTPRIKYLLARALAENPTGLDPRMQANPSGKPTPAIYFKQACRWKDTMADRDALLVN